MPSTEEEWLKIAKAFEEKWNYPLCLGAIDGKHIAIKQPSGSGSLYFNYKHFFSIILLALVDANYCFLYVDVGAPGRCGDAGVFANSSLKLGLDGNILNLPAAGHLPGTQTLCNHHIIGDDAFPLSSNLMKPYPHRNQENSVKIFNYRFSRARRAVENAFGILANRFRVFLTTTALDPQDCEKLVLAACCLHNYLISKQSGHYLATAIDEEYNLLHDANLLSMQPSHSKNGTVNAIIQRNTLREYFSKEGAVYWQENMIS